MSPCHGWVPFSSFLFQPFLFHLRFPLLSFTGSVAVATVSLDHPAFLPGPPLPASHLRGFTQPRSSPLKPLSECARGKLISSAVEVSLDSAGGAPGLESSLMLLTGTVFHAKSLQEAALEQFSQKLKGICQRLSAGMRRGRHNTLVTAVFESVFSQAKSFSEVTNL